VDFLYEARGDQRPEQVPEGESFSWIYLAGKERHALAQYAQDETEIWQGI